MTINLDPKKPRVLVALGGRSLERSVSLETGKAAATALENLGYSVGVIDIGTGALMQTPELDNAQKDPEKLPRVANIPLVDIKRHFDLVFIAMHGAFGEDGGLQSLLEEIKIPYTGSDPFASALSMDKKHAKIVLCASAVPVLQDQIVENENDKIEIKYPVIIKPNNQGSSIGVAVCQNESDARLALKQALKDCEKVLVEPYVAGKELSVIVIEDHKETKALPVAEIKKSSDVKFLDFSSKYSGSAQIICPASITEQQSKKAQETAITAFKALGCSHLAKIDMILDQKNQLFVLEANTIPSLGNNSIAIKAAKAGGETTESFVDRLVKVALPAKRNQEPSL